MSLGDMLQQFKSLPVNYEVYVCMDGVMATLVSCLMEISFEEGCIIQSPTPIIDIVIYNDIVCGQFLAMCKFLIKNASTYF